MGNEEWRMGNEVSHIRVIELKFLGLAKRCNRMDRIQNKQIRADLDIFAITRGWSNVDKTRKSTFTEFSKRASQNDFELKT